MKGDEKVSERSSGRRFSVQVATGHMTDNEHLLGVFLLALFPLSIEKQGYAEK